MRERFSCRDCQSITQPPAPFHVTARGWAGPGLLAMIAFEKFGQHQPLNRQAERYAREGVPLSLSTLADQVGAVCVATLPLYRRLEAHVLAAERLHGDDTTVPVLAAGKTDVARIWDYVRDDRPFGGAAPPAAIFYYSRDRRGEHPQTHLAAWAGVLQADAYGGYNKLYEPGRSPAPITQALCWSHGRRHFFELADVAATATPVGPTPATSATFLAWCEGRGLASIAEVQPLHVAAYVEALTGTRSAPTAKLRLATIQRLFAWLVVSQVIPVNPAASVRGSAHSVHRGKTPSWRRSRPASCSTASIPQPRACAIGR